MAGSSVARFSLGVGCVLLAFAGCSSSDDGLPGEGSGASGGTGGSGGSGGATTQTTSGPDGDGDGVTDAQDNCPDDPNEDQWDTDLDGQGDACEPQDGTFEHPFIITGTPLPVRYYDARDTHDAPSDAVDTYPGFEQLDESGPEYVYAFRLAEAARVAGTIAFDEPAGTDVDLHLLSAVEPLALVTRGHTAIYGLLEPGTYWLVMDTFVSNGAEQLGPYALELSIRPRALAPSETFNETILAAVDYLWASYRLLGYASAVLTHDIPYGDYGVIEATGGAKTMCVAAVMEVMLTAMSIYAEDTGQASVFDFLPIESWQTLDPDHIKAHIWLGHDLDSWGTADALRHFGMGDNVPFEELHPGSFININRTTGTGHAVVFLSYVDLAGGELPSWDESVVGFKYFSSQGGFDEGAGGLDFRYAVFEEYGDPTMPGKTDRHVIYSTDQRYLNTGEMWSPSRWVVQDYLPPPGAGPASFDPFYFDGQAADAP